MTDIREIIKNWDKDHAGEPMFNTELFRIICSNEEIESVVKICDI